MNVSDAFESYGLSNSFSLFLTNIFTIGRQVLSPLVRSAKRNDSMLFVMPVRVLELVVECTLRTL